MGEEEEEAEAEQFGLQLSGEKSSHTQKEEKGDRQRIPPMQIRKKKKKKAASKGEEVEGFSFLPSQTLPSLRTYVV